MITAADYKPRSPLDEPEADGSALALRDATPPAAIVREKRDDTFRALAAIAGWCAYPTIDDHGNRAWLVTRGARTIELPSTDAAEAWLHEQHGG